MRVGTGVGGISVGARVGVGAIGRKGVDVGVASGGAMTNAAGIGVELPARNGIGSADSTISGRLLQPPNSSARQVIKMKNRCDMDQL